MSSAILYLAIIAIWACVLIPRWLRRDTSQAGSGQAAEPAGFEHPVAEEAPGPMDAEVMETAGRAYAGLDEGEAEEVAPFHPVDHDSRARILQARRRMLMMLAGLTVAAFGIVTVRLAAWWVTIPPTGMLAGYLMLLREARHADAERALYAAEAMAESQAQAREPEVAAPQEEQQDARVFDISARVRDELYDQYADTERRAVGD